MAATQSITGRGGSAKVNGVTIGITRWTGRLRKEFADATDSNNYDAATGQTWTSQAPGVLGMDGTVEGNYDLAGTTDANFTQKFKTDGPYATVLNLSPTVSHSSFNADFSDVEYSVSVPGSTMVTFTANFKSNGIITLT
jgi:hypothetical protein